jgi:hypothetical protein
MFPTTELSWLDWVCGGERRIMEDSTGSVASRVTRILVSLHEELRVLRNSIKTGVHTD